MPEYIGKILMLWTRSFGIEDLGLTVSENYVEISFFSNKVVSTMFFFFLYELVLSAFFAIKNYKKDDDNN